MAEGCGPTLNVLVVCRLAVVERHGDLHAHELGGLERAGIQRHGHRPLPGRLHRPRARERLCAGERLSTFQRATFELVASGCPGQIVVGFGFADRPISGLIPTRAAPSAQVRAGPASRPARRSTRPRVCLRPPRPQGPRRLRPPRPSTEARTPSATAGERAQPPSPSWAQSASPPASQIGACPPAHPGLQKSLGRSARR